jgi:hypothetical protein
MLGAPEGDVVALLKGFVVEKLEFKPEGVPNTPDC